jgi:hypothetical protein
MLSDRDTAFIVGFLIDTALNHILIKQGVQVLAL